MSDNIKTTSPSTSVPDSISHGWETVNNQTITPSFSSPSASKAESDSDGPAVEHIEDIANYTGNINAEEDHAVISGPLAERLVSEAITTTPAVAVAVASEAVTEDAGADDEVEDCDGDAGAHAALHFWENEAASGYRGDAAAGKRPGVSEGEYAQAGLSAEKMFEVRLKRMQEIMGMYEAKCLYPFPLFDESKLIETGREAYDPEQDKKEDDYWNKYMAGRSISAIEPDSPGVEDSGAPARRQQYVQARQNRLNSVHEGSSSAGANASASTNTPSLPMPSPVRARRQSSTSVSNVDVSIPMPSPGRPMRESPAHEASASATGITIPIPSPDLSRRQSSVRDASPGNIGVGVSIPFPSPVSSPIRTKTSNSEAYGKALASFDALCQSFNECVQLQERENMNAASSATENEASSSNDVNVNININININGHRNGDTSTSVNGNANGTETDFPCDSTRNNDPDQEYDADGESSDPLALDAMIPRERANPSSPEPEADSGYEEGN